MRRAISRSWSEGAATQYQQELKRRIADITYRTLNWGDQHVPMGLRTLLGALFMVGGVFGFLPVLGFWMFPLGVGLVALDLPWTRHRILAWMVELKKKSQPTSNQ